MTVQVCDICEKRGAERIHIPVGHSIDPPSGRTETDHKHHDLCVVCLQKIAFLLLDDISEESGKIMSESITKNKRLPLGKRWWKKSQQVTLP